MARARRARRTLSATLAADRRAGRTSPDRDGQPRPTAAAFAFLARLPDHGGYLAALLPAGFTFATAFVPLTSQGMSGVREGEKGPASGLFQTSTHLGGALVLTVLATAAADHSVRVSRMLSRLHRTSRVPAAAGGGERGTQVEPECSVGRIAA